MGRHPQYRIDRMATEAALWQGLVNVLRRLLFLPIRRTSREAARDLRREMQPD